MKHTFYTLHTIIPDFGDVRKLTGYSPFTTHLQEILDMARENSGDVTTLAYKYLALHQNIIDSMSKYTAAQTAIAAGNP